MGLLRFYLAMSVVAVHTSASFPIPMLPANLAVEMFFVISGFYMSMILRTKYRHRAAAFYLNRALRLYPAYFFMIALGYGWIAIQWAYIGHPPQGSSPNFYRAMDWWQVGLIDLSNLTMIGQDVLRLLHYKIGSGFMFLHASPFDANMNYIGDSSDGAKWVGEFQKIGQAWSLGAELWFYALVPFLVLTRSRIIIALTFASFAIHLWMWNSFFVPFFFPGLIGFFMVGVLSDRWSIVLPRLFDFTKDIKWDNALGNLSYPIYLCHGLVITVLAKIHYENAYAVMGLSIVLAAIIHHLIETPIETLRARIALANHPICPVAEHRDSVCTAADDGRTKIA